MKKILLIITGLFITMKQSFAASLYNNESVISPPVGSEVLPGGGLQADNIKGSFVFSKILPFVIDYALRFAIAASVIVLVYAGYQYMTAYGNAENQDTARKTIIYALVGLILAITAYGIVNILTRIELV